MDFDTITSSLKKGWEVFKDNAVAYVVGMIIIALIVGIVSVVASVLGVAAIIPAITSGSFTGLGLSFVVLFIAALVLFVLVSPLAFGVTYMGIKGSRGDKVEINDVFYAFRSKNLIIRSLIYVLVFGLIASILSLIPILGQLILIIVEILLFYTAYIYVMTPSENIVYALKESFNVVKENLLITIIAFIVNIVLIMIGMILLGIGVLITAPIAMIFAITLLKELKPDLKDNSDNY
ncbi:MAG: hypothetical protein RBQ94_00930 [Methanimicrococcus sp.]|nr:hypothetical protein [Methanimicrococcus sp.]